MNSSTHGRLEIPPKTWARQKFPLDRDLQREAGMQRDLGSQAQRDMMSSLERALQEQLDKDRAIFELAYQKLPMARLSKESSWMSISPFSC